MLWVRMKRDFMNVWTAAIGRDTRAATNFSEADSDIFFSKIGMMDPMRRGFRPVAPSFHAVCLR